MDDRFVKESEKYNGKLSPETRLVEGKRVRDRQREPTGKRCEEQATSTT